MNDRDCKLLKVLMMPDYRQDNLYQSLLTKALESQQVRVNFPKGYRRILPIFRAVKSQPYDVLHLHWLTPYIKGKNWLTKLIYSLKFIIDLWLTRLSGVKVVWTIHNQISHDCQFPKIELWLRKVLAKLVDKIIVHNSFTVNYLKQDWQVDSSKIEVIPHGHYREGYKKAIARIDARKELDLPLCGSIYLNLGMVRPYKGLENLLHIWSDNHDLLHNTTLVIAGKALDKNYRYKLTELTNQLPNVILRLEFVESDRIHLFYSAVDVVILPFINILTSGSLILAMSYGKPIIAPKLGGINETLGKADYLLYDSNDSKGLLNTLEKSTQINLEQLSQQVIESCDRLDWQKIAIKTQRVYQKREDMLKFDYQN